MARLQNPQNRIDAIRQDYRDKHNLPNSSVLVCRKFDKQVINKNGQKVFDENGKPVTYKGWYEAKNLTVSEGMYVHNSLTFSETNRNDCYCTLNSFPGDYSPVIQETKSGKKVASYRAVERLAYLTGFYLDFDHKAIHTMAKKQQVPVELVEEVKGYEEQIVKALEDCFASDYGMPVISFTGGGYGFYIKIKPLEATEENMQLYMVVWEKLYQKFNTMLEDFLDVFENDHSVLDFVRVIRITGTYNSKTGTHSYFVGRYGDAETGEIYEYSIEDLVSLYHLEEIEANLLENQKKVTHSPLQKREEKKEERKAKSTSSNQTIANHILTNSNNIPDYIQKDNVLYVTKWYQEYVDEKQLRKYIELSIQSLEYLDGRNEVNRNNSLFLIACLKTEVEYSKYGCYIFEEVSDDVKEYVIDYIIELNNNLSIPLEDDELIILINSALKNIYHFRKLETIQKFLNLSDVEFDELGWLDKQKKEKQKKENNNALTKLDKEVIKLYLSGLSDEKIGKELNISKRTSIRIRERLGVKDRTIKYEDVDFEGNKRHLKHKTNSETTNNQTIYEKNLIQEEKIVKMFPIKYKVFFQSPITSYSYFVNHNYEYKVLGNTIKRELIKAYYRNLNCYMQKIGVRSIEERDGQLLYLRNAMNEKMNLSGNIEAIRDNEEAAKQLRSGKLTTMIMYKEDGTKIETQVTFMDIYKPVFGEHLQTGVRVIS